MVTIRKYSNRKLYDTLRKTYISLLEVQAMVESNQPFEVIDYQTKQDVTELHRARALVAKLEQKERLANTETSVSTL